MKTLGALYFMLLLNSASAQFKNLAQETLYWPNGNPKAITYNDGVYNQGIWDSYDTTGILIQQDKYINGNKIYFNKWVNGNQTIIEGNGDLTEYYINGAIKSQGKIKEGKKYGLWHEYYPSGNIANIIEYVEWEGIYKSELEYKTKLIVSYDSLGNKIGLAGSGIIIKTDLTGLTTDEIERL